MRVLIQRVKEAAVSIEGTVVGQIPAGLLLLVGFEESDNNAVLEPVATKISKLRIFNDQNGVMNLSVNDIGGQMLVVSQFTLYAQTRKGNRPSYIRAAAQTTAAPLYEQFVSILAKYSAYPVQTGRFGADMQVSLINDGPVTIWIDTKTDD
ncbi:MAG: D-tyrosyl-tRNA(Tyr) deacylase [Prevotellaceae bacterium]|jgi:D-tyrosyl-tRNA(Tyr) deacylase|nr:D-tyrosyl-tRNA(Tyr) deacylase [Prevotellaceae bacterium]